MGCREVTHLGLVLDSHHSIDRTQWSSVVVGGARVGQLVFRDAESVPFGHTSQKVVLSAGDGIHLGGPFHSELVPHVLNDPSLDLYFVMTRSRVCMDLSQVGLNETW